MLLNIWCTPRSLSTAFEKMVANRGDFLVFGEPYCQIYLKYREANYSKIAAVSEFEILTKGILAASKTKNVFVKEMAHHVIDYIDGDLIENSVNTFLIRHPQFSVPSLYKILDNYTDEEAGFEKQLQLFEWVRAKSGRVPIVIDGEILRQSPATVVKGYFDALGLDPMLEALNWNEGSRQDWVSREAWHRQAINSTKFLPNSTAIDLDMYPARVRETVERFAPIYEHMRSFSIHEVRKRAGTP